MPNQTPPAQTTRFPTGNVFDQFDPPKPPNIFDQFDPPNAAQETAKWAASIRDSVPNETSPGMAALVSAGRVFDRISAGVTQLYNSTTGNTAANAALASDQSDSAARQAALDKAHPIAAAIGTALPYVATAPLSGETLLGTMATQGLANAVPGALSYGDASTRASAAALGAAGGAGGVGVGALAGKAIGAVARPFGKPSADAAAAADRLAARGVDTTTAQATGSPALTDLNTALAKAPFAGKMQQTVAAQQQGQVNRAVANTFGSNATKLDTSALQAARDNLGQQFDDLSARNAVSSDSVDALQKQFGQILMQSISERGGDTSRVVGNKIGGILDKVADDGTIPGAAYKSLDSDLGRVMRSTQNGELRNDLGTVRDSLRSAMDASITPEDQAAWAMARNQYANLMRAAPAIDFASGNVSIPKLYSAVQARNPTVKFNGGGTLGTLAKDLALTIGNSLEAGPSFYPGLASAKALGALATGGLAVQHYAPAMLPTAALGTAAALAVPPIAQTTLNSSLVRALALRGIPPLEAAKLPVSTLVQMLGQAAGAAAAQTP